MRLMTPDGDFVSVSKRSWPIAGLDYGTSWLQGNNTIKLTTSATDEARYATYVRLYRENPWVNAAVTALSRGLATKPLKTYRLQEDAQRQRVRWDIPKTGPDSAGVQLDRLLNAPTNGIGPQRRMRRTVTDFKIFGNALWVKTRDANGAIADLEYVPWRRVRVHRGESVEVLAFEWVGAKGSRMFSPDDVVHFSAGDDPDSPIGISPMEALKHTLALHEALQRHLVSFFENQARPSANIKLQPGTKPENIELIRNQIRELYTSPDNAGKVIVTTGDFQAMTASPDQSAIIELAKLSREEISAVFRIPGPVLGSLEHAIKSNVRELREQYIRDVVGADAPAFEDEFHAQLIYPNPAWRRFFVEFDLDSALRPDLEARAAAYSLLGSTYTTNERRRAENLPDLPYPEADTVEAAPGGTYLGFAPEPEPAQGVTADDMTEEDL